MPLLQKDIRKLQPLVPQTVRRRDSSSPFVTTDSKTSSFQEANPSSTTIPSTTQSLHRSSKQYLRKNDGNESNSNSALSSPVVYWSEFETPEQEPYTVPVDESTALLPWFKRRRERDLERAASVEYDSEDSFLRRTLEKIRGAVEFEVKTSADGLSTLFYEKDFHTRRTDTSEDNEEEYNSEDSSDIQVVQPESASHHYDHRLSRSQLLNRGYFLCVVGCTILFCIFGFTGLNFNGEATGIAFVLVGFLISMTLEIVSLVRFIMYTPFPSLLSIFSPFFPLPRQLSSLIFY